MTIRERAAEILLKRGWVQGTNKTKDGKVCLRQAIWEASEDLKASTSDFHDALDATRIKIGDYAIGFWNDTPGRKVEEVLEALKEEPCQTTKS